MAPQDLAAEHEALLHFLYQCPVGVIEMDATGAVSRMNALGAQLLLPLAGADGIGNLVTALAPHAPGLGSRLGAFREPRGTIYQNEPIELGHQDTGPSVLALTILKLNPSRLMAVLSDISELMARQQDIRANERRLRAIFDGVRDCAIFSLDAAGRIDSWNRSGEQLLGHTAGEILGSTTDALHGPTEQTIPPLAERLSLARRGTCTSYQGWYQHRNGARFWGEENLSPLADDQGDVVGFSVVVRDITDRHETELSLRAQADTDPLTGLPNRRRFEDLLASEIERFRRYGSLLSIIMIEVESFSVLDNAESHHLRALVLQEIARTCRETIRAVDSAARLGGGCFAVLLPATNAASALVVAQRLRRATASALHRHGATGTRFALALGVATAHPATRDTNELMGDAHRALHEARKNGRNRIVVHPYPA